jgi:TolB-like protein/DNA-binding winged helix-turn-helix (wHTH) protein/tetratricopeptide (TPR) repeat protein
MAGQIQVGPWLVEPSLSIVSRNGTAVHLEPKVMEVLLCLAAHAGEVLPKEELLKAVWPDTFVTEDALKRCISELRRVFEDDAREPRVIETIPKRGYRLVAPVVPANGARDSSTQATPSPVITGATGTGTRRRWRWTAAVGGAVLISAMLISLRGRWGDAGAVPPIHSLAVLPLQNLSADPAQEYFSDGMTDALITDLAQIGSLKVISRTSVVHYKKTEKTLPEIAGELKVDGIVEGTVQREGDRVRITAQLIYAPSDKHLWAKSYERDMRGVFSLEQDVAEDIANQVQARLMVPKRALASQPQLVKPEVLEAYIQGSYHLQGSGRGGGDEEVTKAEEYFQHAIDLDPNFARAYIGLAQAHNSLSRGGAEDLAIVRTTAERAVELDPSSSDAILVLGDAQHMAWDWHGAEENYRHAVALNPNSALAHDAMGGLLDDICQLEEAWKEFEIAQELDPNQDHLADPLYTRGQFDRAIEIRQRIALRDPRNGYNHYALAMNYAQKQMFKEFALEMSKAATLSGIPDVAGRLQHAYDRSGGHAALRQWAKELERLAANGELYLPLDLAGVYATLGDKDRALYWLEDYRQHHELATAQPGTGCFGRNPRLAPLRSDPRFSEFLRRVGLPQ